MDKLIVVIAAAGLGKRLGLGMNKAFVSLGQAPVLAYNLRQIDGFPGLSRVIVVVRPGEVEEAEEILRTYREEYFPHISWQVVTGGEERQDSVYNALRAIPETEGFIAIHDGARPFATAEVFARVWEAARETGAAVAAVPVKNTIKVVDEAEVVQATPVRSTLRAVQTPQIFRLELLKKAYDNLMAKGLSVTDDAGAVELLGVRVVAALGSYENNKITTPEDLVWAKGLLAARGEKDMTQEIRVGNGFDVHQLVSGRSLILCGVEVPYEKGLLGHSDADVATHALMDALLGAAGMGDIGRHFPDTDPAYEGADSIKLLRHVMELLEAKGWKVGNADVTIIAQRPKLAPYRAAMEEILRRELRLAEDAINVKATTTEQLGFTGRGEGIAAQAVVSLVCDRP